MPEVKKHTKSLPRWIADYNSLALYGAGAPIDFASFAVNTYGAAGQRRIPSGTVVHLVNGKITDGAGSGQAYLLFADVDEAIKALGVSGHGLVTGGNVYEAWLPGATGSPRVLTAAQKTALGLRFHFQ